MKSSRTQDFDKQEQIPCFLTPPWRQGPATYFDMAAKRARARHDKEHTKKDSIEGGIGSAVLCPLTQQVRSVHMGSHIESTSYAVKLQGIDLALQMLKSMQGGQGSHRMEK
jgi:hypothetical protein